MPNSPQVQGVKGSTQEWSDPLNFTLTLPAPTVQTPGGTVTTAQPAFTWTSVAWATSYTVWVNDLTAGQEQRVTSPARRVRHVLDANHGADYRTQLPMVGRGRQRHDRCLERRADLYGGAARAKCASSQRPVATPQPAFTWTGVAWASSYTIWVNDLTSGQSKALYTTGVTGTSWTPATALKAGDNYQCRSKRWRATTASGATRQNFTESLSGPTLQGPSGTITSTQPAFTWNSVTWATSYTIWVNDLTTGQSQAQYATNLSGTT